VIDGESEGGDGSDAQDEVNQEESEQNEDDGLNKSSVFTTLKSEFMSHNTEHSECIFN